MFKQNKKSVDYSGKKQRFFTYSSCAVQQFQVDIETFFQISGSRWIYAEQNINTIILKYKYNHFSHSYKCTIESSQQAQENAMLTFAVENNEPYHEK